MSSETFAQKLLKSLSVEEKTEIESQKFCKYCKTISDHFIDNCPKIKEKEEREARKKEEKVRLENKKFELKLESIKIKYGSKWYRKVENTDYDCEEAYELRMEEEYREEEEYWREQEEEKECRRRDNKRDADVKEFLDKLTPENSKEHVSLLVDGDLEITPYQVHQHHYYHENVDLVFENMTKDLLNELKNKEYYEEYEYDWGGYQMFIREQCYEEVEKKRLEEYNKRVERGEIVKINI